MPEQTEPMDLPDVELLLHSPEDATIRFTHGEGGSFDVGLSVIGDGILARVSSSDGPAQSVVERAVLDLSTGSSFMDTPGRQPAWSAPLAGSAMEQSVTPSLPQPFTNAPHHRGRKGAVHDYA